MIDTSKWTQAQREAAYPVLTRLVHALREVARSTRTFPILRYCPTPLQLGFHRDTRPWVLLVGANGIGKTVALVSEVYWWVTRSHPFKSIPKPPFTIYVVSKDLRKLENEEGQFIDMLKAMFPPGHPMGRLRKVPGDSHFYFFDTPDGRIAIICKSDQQDELTTFEGGKPVLIIIDEEVEFTAYKAASYRRARGWAGGQVLLGATSLAKDKKGLAIGGNQWIYRELMAGVCGCPMCGDDPKWDKYAGGGHPDRAIYHGDVWDNAHFPGGSENILRQMRQTPADDIPARFLGDMQPRAKSPILSLVGLKMIWERRIQSEIIGRRATVVMARGSDTPRILDNDDGRLFIYREPIPGHPYFVGIDVARGGKRDDLAAVQVVDFMTLEQAAVWHGVIDPEGLGDISAGIGFYYNTAMLNPELIKEGFATATILRMFYGYPNFFRMRRFTKDDATMQHEVGWTPNAASKPMAVGVLQTYTKPNEAWDEDGTLQLRAPHLRLYHRATYDECRTLERHENGKIGAPNEEGMHDDLVMALAAALYAAVVSTVHLGYVPPRIEGGNSWKPNPRPKEFHPVMGAVR